MNELNLKIEKLNYLKDQINIHLLKNEAVMSHTVLSCSMSTNSIIFYAADMVKAEKFVVLFRAILSELQELTDDSKAIEYINSKIRFLNSSISEIYSSCQFSNAVTLKQNEAIFETIDLLKKHSFTF
jgi:HD superfamily phosphohydrolase YqeK